MISASVLLIYGMFRMYSCHNMMELASTYFIFGKEGVESPIKKSINQSIKGHDIFSEILIFFNW